MLSGPLADRLARKDLRGDAFYLAYRGDVLEDVPAGPSATPAAMARFAAGAAAAAAAEGWWRHAACGGGGAEEDERPLRHGGGGGEAVYRGDAGGDFFLVPRGAALAARLHPEVGPFQA